MSSFRITAWITWVVVSIFYAYQYILRVMPNVMLQDIMTQFNIDAVTFGQFSGVYYLGYSLMHLPIGIMLDRFGPKKVIPICILLTVIGLLPLLLADYWVYPIIGRVLIGMGSSAAILGVFKITRMTFSEKRFPRMLSVSVMIGLLGAIYGGGPMNYMRDLFGYQPVVEFIALGGVILALISYWILPNTTSATNSSVMSDIKEVLGNSKVIWTCICAGLMVGPLEGFADVWGTAFLKQVYGFDGSLAASLPSTIFVGMCFGAPFLNLIAEKMRSYLGTIIGAGIIMIVCFAILLTWQHLSSSTITLNFVLIGICSAYQILAIYKASTYVHENVAGLTTALANMIIMIFGYIFHSLMGGIINNMGGPNVSQALIYGISIIPAALCLGTLGFILLSKKKKGVVIPLSE